MKTYSQIIKTRGRRERIAYLISLHQAVLTNVSELQRTIQKRITLKDFWTGKWITTRLYKQSAKRMLREIALLEAAILRELKAYHSNYIKLYEKDTKE